MMWFCLYASSAPRHCLLGKGHPMSKLLIYIVAFQGHQCIDQVLGTGLEAWRQAPSLPQ